MNFWPVRNEFLASGNFNFKKQPLQSEILLTELLKEGLGSFWHDAITRKAVQMMGVSPTFMAS